jgi:hypothetical protein
VTEAEAAAAPPAKGGKGKESLSNDDLARLIVVKPSQRSPLKPQVGEGDGMAAAINDGLEQYARELQRINTRRGPTQPLPAGSGGGSGGGSFVAARPPRAPGAPLCCLVVGRGSSLLGRLAGGWAGETAARASVPFLMNGSAPHPPVPVLSPRYGQEEQFLPLLPAQGRPHGGAAAWPPGPVPPGHLAARGLAAG